MRVEKGTKLGGCVREGKWLGMDEESKEFEFIGQTPDPSLLSATSISTTRQLVMLRRRMMWK